MPGEVLLVRVTDNAERAIGHLRSPIAKGVRVFRAVESPLWYAYVDLETACVSALRMQLNLAMERMSPIMSIPGAAAGADAPYRYVVETDVLPEAEADFNDWYDREHLPGLAAVPGTVHAWRYRHVDGGPRYHACYDLASLATYGSPPWLAVRATEWSNRVRPAFRNARRVMLRRVDD